MKDATRFWQRGSFLWISIVFFFLGAAPGFWVPSVGHLLTSRGDAWLVPWAFLPSSVAALLSPLAFGALADRKMNAEKVLALSCGVGAIFLWLAFRSLLWGWNGWWFVAFMMVAALISAPMWSLLSTIAMRPMKDPKAHFPLVRLGGTIGWIVSGFAVGKWLSLEGSPHVGDWAAGTRLVLAAMCFLLPATPPSAVVANRTWKDRLGLGALQLMKERDQRVYFLTTATLSIPLAAFYVYTPVHLAALGDESPTATMALGQISEVVAMLVVAFLLGRFRVKTVLTVALVLAVVRYGLFAWVGNDESMVFMVFGIALHGVIYTFFFITGQVFMEQRVPRDMRAQAQALLSVMSMGVGSLIGYVFIHWLHGYTAAVGDWRSFWAVLMALTALSTLGFVLRYRSQPVSQ